MKCDNYEDDKCRYFQMLQGTGEELPTGCEPDSGECTVLQEHGDWDMADHEDCDMIDLE